MAVALVAVVMAQPLVMLAPAAEAVTAKKPVTPAALVTERPDVVSAMLTARAQGSRVEILSERTEFDTSWANPDGTITTEAHAGPIRFKDANGQWQDIDLNLDAPAADGSIKPHRHGLGMKISGRTSGATDDLIDVGEGKGKSVSIGWSKKLPTPTVSGDSATYPDIDPGVDMTVTALPTGFEQNFVLKSAPTGPVSFDVPIKTAGLTARAETDGSISFVDAKNNVVSRIPAATAWDATLDPHTGDHPNTSPVKLTITQKSKGRAVLTVTPDASWLADPSRAYPVTIDPSYASGSLSPNYDAFIQQGYSTDQSSATELKLGNNGSGQVARSLLHFPISGISGYTIMSASLNLYETYSWSCTAKPWEVWSISSAGTSNTWANQPSWWNSVSTSSTTKGYSSSCAAGWVSQPVTSAVQWWASAGSSSSASLGLRASDETDPYGWKKFSSAEGSNAPYITYTYDRAPGGADAPGVSPAASYTPPGGSFGWYIGATSPSVWTKASDPDGDTVAYNIEVHQGSTSGPVVATCTTPFVASGGTAACTPSPALADNTAYAVRAYAGDPYLPSTVWSPWTSIIIADTTPAAPGISCPDYANNTWVNNPPVTAETCTVSAPGSGYNAPGYIRYSIDGGTETRVAINPQGGSTTVSVPNSTGGHAISARAENPSGLLSSYSNYQFGYGTAGLTSPAANPRVTTTAGVAISAAGPPRGASAVPTAKLRWRIAGSGQDQNTGWNDATSAPLTVKDNGTGGIAVTGTWDTSAETRDSAAGIDLNASVPRLLDVQVCLTYSSGTQCTWGAGPASVLRVPHAFGGSFPTTAAGPGQVALWTGEFETDATDATGPGYQGDLSISRSASTYAGTPTPAAAVFGPGWTADLAGPAAGLGGDQLIDSTRTDGTLALIAADGSALVFTTPTGARRTGTDLPTGTYQPADANTKTSVTTLSVSGSGAATKATVTQADGTVTIFTVTTAPTNGADAAFATTSVTQPGTAAGQTAYATDGAGRVTRILAAAPAGVTCTMPTDPTAALLVAGCRSLRIQYATTTSGTDVAGQVKAIWLDVWDPTKSAGSQTEIQVAAYGYDSAHRLVSVTDLRSGLTTGYSYDGTSTRLATITPPGLTPYTLHYTASPDFKLASITRPRPAGDPTGGTATLTSVVYNAPLSGATGLPNLGASDVAAWNQAAAPSYAAAVFGPGHPAPGSPGASDWPYATVYYTDTLGRTVNTAQFGAGNWQITSTDYDTNGNTVRQLDAAAIAAVKANNLPSGATVDQMATTTVYNTDGTLVTDTYDPARWATVSDGTTKLVRPRTHTDYDQGAPNNDTDASGMPYLLPTTVTVTAADPGTGATIDTVSTTVNGYDPIQTGDASGWDLGAATKVTTKMPGTGNDITRITRYDAQGDVIETRQPMSTGSDAGTRDTTYWTATGAGTCAGRPEWAGLVCRVAPGDGTGSNVPTTSTTGYSVLLEPATVVNSGGSATRTVTSTYLTDGRTDKVMTAVSGLSGSTPVTDTETVYDPATGLATQLVGLDAAHNQTSVKQMTVYDSWGRVISFTASAGDTTTATYDAAGRISTVTDSQGTTTTLYDTSTEHRGLPTSETVSNGTNPAVTFTGSYDAAGNLTVQNLPGGITATATFDTAGDQTGLVYSGQITTTNPDGSTTVNPNGSWLAWSRNYDAAERVRREWTPDGSAFTSTSGKVGNAVGYDRQYTYDQSGRLTEVDDRTATTTGTTLDPTVAATAAAPCTVRSYSFNANAGRTSLTTRTGADGTCPTTGGSTTNWSYNSADQLTGGYSYDALGRNTTIPAANTPNGAAAGNLTIGYYDNDAVHTLTQNGTTSTYSLDIAGRRNTTTTGPTGGNTTGTLALHYDDLSDNPAWTQTTTGGTTTLTRYLQGLDGSLGATITGNAVQLSLANPHGDIITTVTVPTTGPATTINAWSDYTEYGTLDTPAAATAVGGTIGYTWLGANQRGTDFTGLTLMGARLYNNTTGQFTSLDPQYGGNDTAYNYPTDPVNSEDLDGNYSHHYHSCSNGGCFSLRVFRAGFQDRIDVKVVGAKFSAWRVEADYWIWKGWDASGPVVYRGATGYTPPSPTRDPEFSFALPLQYTSGHFSVQVNVEVLGFGPAIFGGGIVINRRF